MSLEYMVLKPMIDDLERRVIAGAKETDRWGAEVGAAFKSLLSRVEELEKRIAAGFPQGVTTTTVSNGNGTACSNCLKVAGVETGVVIDTMPPMYEMKCPACGDRWSKW